MAKRNVKLTGISQWAKVFSQNRDMTGFKPTPDAIGSYEDCNGACTIDLIMDDDNYKILQASKSMKVGTDDDEGRGKKVTFVRKFDTGYDWSSGAPLVVKSDGGIWDFDVDGNIGNGSTVEVYLTVYDIKKYGNTGTRLEKVRVIDHVEYIQPQDDGDVPPSSKKPSSKSADAEVLF